MCPNCNSMNYDSTDGETFDCATCGTNFVPEEAHEAEAAWEQEQAVPDFPMGYETHAERAMDLE